MPLVNLQWRRVLAALAACVFLAPAAARDVRVAVLRDGEGGRPVFSAAAIERAIAEIAAPDTRILVPEDKRFAGDWSLDGAAAALERALTDRDVDVVITLGILTSQQAARRARLPKPVIAPLAIDPILQSYPLVEGRSGRHNFAYVADFQSVANELRTFHQITGFKHLAVLVDASLLLALPQLCQQGRRTGQDPGRTYQHRARR